MVEARSRAAAEAVVVENFMMKLKLVGDRVNRVIDAQ